MNISSPGVQFGSIWPPNRGGYGGGGYGSAGYGGDDDSDTFSSDLSGGLSPVTNLTAKKRADLVKFIDNLIETATINDGTIELNGNSYDVRVKADGTFTATREDGVITLKAYYLPRTPGLSQFDYTNSDKPANNVSTREEGLVELAQELGRKLYDLKKNGNSSGGFDA